VPLRNFAGGGEIGLHPGLGDDMFADFLVLVTPGDELDDWLSGGEAMIAVWLTATVNNVAVSVLSDVIEVPDARTLVASLLPEQGCPQLVLRIGIAAHPTPPCQPTTPDGGGHRRRRVRAPGSGPTKHFGPRGSRRRDVPTLDYQRFPTRSACCAAPCPTPRSERSDVLRFAMRRRLPVNAVPYQVRIG
jgi:hypothetical protein